MEVGKILVLIERFANGEASVRLSIRSFAALFDNNQVQRDSYCGTNRAGGAIKMH